MFIVFVKLLAKISRESYVWKRSLDSNFAKLWEFCSGLLDKHLESSIKLVQSVVLASGFNWCFLSETINHLFLNINVFSI